MSTYTLPPIAPEEPQPTYSYTVELDGVTVRYDLVWRTRSQGWYLSMYTDAGEALLLGARLSLWTPVLWRHQLKGAPPGQILLVAADGSDVEPTDYDTLGSVHLLVYLEADSIESVYDPAHDWAPYQITV